MTFINPYKHKQNTKFRHKLTGQVLTIASLPTHNFLMGRDGMMVPAYVLTPYVTRGELGKTALSQLRNGMHVSMAASYLDDLPANAVFEQVETQVFPAGDAQP